MIYIFFFKENELISATFKYYFSNHKKSKTTILLLRVYGILPQEKFSLRVFFPQFLTFQEKLCPDVRAHLHYVCYYYFEKLKMMEKNSRNLNYSYGEVTHALNVNLIRDTNFYKN